MQDIYTRRKLFRPSHLSAQRCSKKTNKQTNLSAFVVETLQEALQQLVSIIDALCILSYNPDHGSTRLRLIQGVQVFTQRGDHTLIPGQSQNTTWCAAKYCKNIIRKKNMKHIEQNKLIEKQLIHVTGLESTAAKRRH